MVSYLITWHFDGDARYRTVYSYDEAIAFYNECCADRTIHDISLSTVSTVVIMKRDN